MGVTITSTDGRELYVAQSATDVRAAVVEAVKAGANLTGAYLAGADLTGAYLAGADLTLAYLTRANLAGAYLVGADLTGADLVGADLTCADLTGADLADANLTRAKNAKIIIARTRILPDEGDVIGWKKARGTRIVKLRIPADVKRSHAMGRKCRTERAEVLAIYDGDAEVSEAVSLYDSRFRYRVGETVTPTEPFDEDMWNECSAGIHFYISRLEAEHHV